MTPDRVLRWPKQKLDHVRNATLKAVTDYRWERMQKVDALSPVKTFATKFLRYSDIGVFVARHTRLEHVRRRDAAAGHLQERHSPQSCSSALWASMMRFAYRSPFKQQNRLGAEGNVV